MSSCESHIARVRLNLRDQFAGRHLRADRAGRGGEFGEVSDHELPHAGMRDDGGDLRIKRGEIERNEDLRLTVGELVLERLGRIERRIGHDCSARAQRAEIGDQELRAIRQIEPDVDARLHAQSLKALRRAIDQLIEFGVADPPPHEVDRRLVAPLLRGRRE